MKRITLITSGLFFSLCSFGSIGPVTGPSGVCEGNPMYLYDTSSGGGWSSSDTLILTVSSTGFITGISAGMATITYTVGTSFQTKAITVYPAPLPIIGSDFICANAGARTYYNYTPGGGIWSSATLGIDWTGPYSVGVTASASDNLYFTDSAGCETFKYLAAVHPPIPPISGDSVINQGTSTTFHMSYTGGAWGSADTTIATINPYTGVATGVSIGTTYISYEIGCAGYFLLRVTWPVSTPILSRRNENNIRVYPNPVATELNITALQKIQKLTVFNLLGQAIYHQTPEIEQVLIDVSQWPVGVYFVKINGSEVRRFVKE